ncbi:MAG: bifunctional diaminohydroxyphosphoribosylaminopyrimidine deaminase/5-amino-6-(5-phosphoribosylamino)uracil reductase RibD [Vulcanimicrobiaceae bacterium]
MAGRRGRAVAGFPYLARACELAQRGLGSTSPNPPVGAVVVRDGRTLGEGYHHVRGAPHAEVEAFARARARGIDVRGATMYVSLEPCNHHGTTPPCTDAIVAAGIARVIIGAADPNPKTDGAGIARLRASGVEVELIGDPWSRALIEQFARAIRSPRPYLSLKMAASIDGYVAPKPGSHWLTGKESRERVREMRYWHDAVMIGAGTARIDDPQLTVRPPHARQRPYARVIVCEDHAIPASSRALLAEDGYARTILLAPSGVRAEFAELEARAECIFIGGGDATQFDLGAALVALKDAGISSVLCEGGPTLAAALVAGGFVDRLIWLIAPVFLSGPEAVPVLAPGAAAGLEGWEFEAAEPSGDDLLLTANLRRNV